MGMAPAIRVSDAGPEPAMDCQVHEGAIFIAGIRQDARDATARRFQRWTSNPGTSAASPGRAEFSSSSRLTPLDHPRGAPIR